MSASQTNNCINWDKCIFNISKDIKSKKNIIGYFTGKYLVKVHMQLSRNLKFYFSIREQIWSSTNFEQKTDCSCRPEII